MCTLTCFVFFFFPINFFLVPGYGNVQCMPMTFKKGLKFMLILSTYQVYDLNTGCSEVMIMPDLQFTCIN